MTRDEAITLLARSSTYGHLGLFAGTGFSINLTNGKAPSFDKLLRRAAKKLKVAFNFDDADSLRGKGYPQIASELVRLRAADLKAAGEAKPRRKALAELKDALSEICHLHPALSMGALYRKLLRGARPAWVITTNYDNIMESLLDGVSVLPSEALVSRHDLVPIYHLHGDRRVPSSIVITEQDYVRLLGPVEYRQLKLSLTLTESATLMLGYSYGDINVRSAAQWVNTFRKSSPTKRLKLEKHQGRIVQALYKPGTTNPDPYLGPDGELILEVENLEDFLAILYRRCKRMRKGLRTAKREIEKWLADPDHAQKMATDPVTRQNFAALVEKSRRHLPPGSLLGFLRDALDPVWEKARADSGFAHYDVFLKIILDLFAQIPLKRMHPSIFAYLADRLNSVGGFLSHSLVNRYGEAWEASATWRKAKPGLPLDLKSQLCSYAEEQNAFSLEAMLQ